MTQPIYINHRTMKDICTAVYMPKVIQPYNAATVAQGV
jgi:hypothetical protein